MFHKKTIYIIGLTILIILGAVFFFVVKNDIEDDASSASEGFTREVPDGSKEYRSKRFNFSILYPENLSVQDFTAGKGASTYIFQDVETVQGFQIFAVPHDKEQITEERFRQDVPSGVRNDPQDVTIDGARGSSFYSEATTLGETYEVWFIHDGYLFEVTTIRPLEAWLVEILKSWRFIEGSNS